MKKVFTVLQVALVGAIILCDNVFGGGRPDISAVLIAGFFLAGNLRLR